MRKKTVTIVVLLIAFSATITASAAVSVGVKKGDWIEYTVTYTGIPPEGHEVSWARMEVLDVKGTEITLNITTADPNGALSSETITLNLETGNLGDDFIIPANLKDGDVFYDKNFGNIIIGNVETRTYAGAVRVVVIGAKDQNVDYWDQETGVLLEGVSTYAEYTMTAKVNKTNLWLSQQTGLDQTVLIGVASTVLIVGIATIIFVTRRKKK